MFNWQNPSIGLDNGLAPNRRQAIIWTNADPIHWRIYAALGGDELTEAVAESSLEKFQTYQNEYAFESFPSILEVTWL